MNMKISGIMIIIITATIIMIAVAIVVVAVVEAIKIILIVLFLQVWKKSFVLPMTLLPPPLHARNVYASSTFRTCRLKKRLYILQNIPPPNWQLI
jgi:hypothetical protein